jgi:lipopolysaccharide biosynthesis glycosyltransferase/glycosyltransferase involved in cell wall biosynthesis
VSSRPESSEPIPVIIAGLDGISGVSAWSFRLRDALRDHPRYRVVLVNCRETGNKVGTFDCTAPSQAAMRDVLRNFAPAIVVPNFIWPIFDVCAELLAEGVPLRCVGYCRADSDPEYYNPLAWYEPLVSRFAAVSPECAKGLATRLPHRREHIATLPTGVHVPQRLDRTYQSAPLRLVYGGRIVQQQKRVMDFVPLVEALLACGCDFTFDIVGQGRQLYALKSAMAEINHGGRVRFRGKVSPTGMDVIWRDHDIFVQCSDFEGTSNSMLESMAWGTIPVVTQTESGLAGIVEHGVNGFVVPVGDMEAMAEVLCSLAGDAARAEALGRAAHDTAKAFAIEDYADRFVALLDETLSEPLRVWPPARIAQARPLIEGLDLPEDVPGTPSLLDRIAARVLGASAPDAVLPTDFTTPDTLVLVAAADDNFVMPLAAMMKSVLCNLAAERRIVLYIIDGGIHAENKTLLLESWASEWCLVRWLQPEWAALDAMKVTGHVNILTYARLLIPSLLPPQHAKAIYLDSDLIVLGDLAELWDVEPGVHHLLAVQDMTAPYMCSEMSLPNFAACAPYLSAAEALTNFRELGIPPHAKYFNAGVLVFNLAKWRDTRAARTIIEYLRAHPNAVRWWDQDGLNAILHDQWGELDLRWNQIPHIFRYPSWRESPFSEAEYNGITQTPKIIHFSARSKPWHGDNTHFFRDKFFAYLDQSAWKGWRPIEPMPLSRNGNFAAWAGEAPEHWALLPGTVAEPSRESRLGGTPVRILPGGNSGLEQQLLTPPALSGARLVVSVDGRCDQRGALELTLTLTTDARAETFRATHPGHGAWATLRHEIDLPDNVPTSIHCRILLRAKAAALVENFRGLAFPRERGMEWDVPRAVDLRRPIKTPLWRRWTSPYLNLHARAKAAQRKSVFSIILSNYNGAEFLEEALRSVAQQDFTFFEFIVVDDASTDRSREIIEAVAAQFPERIRTLFKEANEGQAAGFNDGFRMAQGDVICLIDSDDVWFSDKLKQLAQLVEANPGCAIYQHNLYKLVDGEVSTEKFRDVVQTGDLLGYTRRTRHFPYFVPTSGLAFSRQALESVMPIPPAFRVCADGFLTRTALCFGPIASTNECWGAYRVHGGNSVFENPEHDSFAYTNGLLIPTLNAFYKVNGIDLRFEVKAGSMSIGLAPRVRATNRSLMTKILDSSIRELIRELRRRMPFG